jgi:TonB family protein
MAQVGSKVANESGNAFPLLKITFLFLAGFLLWNTMAMPRAEAQTSQPPASSQTSPAQTAPPQTAQPQAPPSQSSQSQASPSSSRKAKLSTPPEYPELARKMNIQGVARVLLTVSPDGKVGTVKELGGNPILVAALMDAVKKWKYEPADHESAVEVRYEFVQTH